MLDQFFLSLAGIVGFVAGLAVSRAAHEEIVAGERFFRLFRDAFALLALGFFLVKWSWAVAVVAVILCAFLLFRFPGAIAGHISMGVAAAAFLFSVTARPFFAALFFLLMLVQAGVWQASRKAGWRLLLGCHLVALLLPLLVIGEALCGC